MIGVLVLVLGWKLIGFISKKLLVPNTESSLDRIRRKFDERVATRSPPLSNGKNLMKWRRQNEDIIRSIISEEFYLD